MRPKEKSSLLCPNCRKLISADEPACPYCGLSGPGKGNFFPGRFAGLSIDITKTLIYMNAGFYILSLILILGLWVWRLFKIGYKIRN